MQRNRSSLKSRIKHIMNEKKNRTASYKLALERDHEKTTFRSEQRRNLQACCVSAWCGQYTTS